MTFTIADILIGVLGVALIGAAVGDLRTRTIPNWLNAGIALLAIPFWWATGVDLWPGVALHVGIAALVFILFAIAFHLGAMGGGDVKMAAAIALWLPLLLVLKLIVIMSLAGGVLTLIMLIRHRLAKAEHALEIPYGVAIAFGACWVIGEPYLNHFA